MPGSDGFKAIADSTRREILKLLRDGDMPAGAIAERFEISWPSVSRHLTVLSAAGLVKATRNGQRVIYSSSPSGLADIVSELADMAQPGRAVGEARQPNAAEATQTKPRIKVRVRPRLNEGAS
jgi:ArsR family transcriptional regulator